MDKGIISDRVEQLGRCLRCEYVMKNYENETITIECSMCGACKYVQDRNIYKLDPQEKPI